MQMLRLTTFAISIFTFPFASYLMITFFKERLKTNFSNVKLNFALQFSSMLIAFGSFLSATLSFLLFIGYDFTTILSGESTQGVFNLRNIVFALSHAVFCVVLTIEHVKANR